MCCAYNETSDAKVWAAESHYAVITTAVKAPWSFAMRTILLRRITHLALPRNLHYSFKCTFPAALSR